MSFVQAVKAFGDAHDKVRELGEVTIRAKYINLIEVAAAAHAAGSSVNEPGPWRAAYHAALAANQAISRAAYLVGHELAPVKPPRVGPIDIC